MFIYNPHDPHPNSVPSIPNSAPIYSQKMHFFLGTLLLVFGITEFLLYCMQSITEFFRSHTPLRMFLFSIAEIYHAEFYSKHGTDSPSRITEFSLLFPILLFRANSVQPLPPILP